jgi:hypothetical protein
VGGFLVKVLADGLVEGLKGKGLRKADLLECEKRLVGFARP